MVRSFSQVVAWAKSHPHPHQGGTWNMRCEQFVNNAGGFNYGFSTALLDFQSARNSGNLLTPKQLNISSVPTGWLLFWDYGRFGHVAFKAPGNRALMASSYLTERFGTSALGYVSAPGYQAATGHRYLGASPWHGPETLNGVNVLTSADKAWIKDAIADAVRAERDDIANSVWKKTAKSVVGTNKSVTLSGQLLVTRKEVNEIRTTVNHILEELQVPDAKS